MVDKSAKPLPKWAKKGIIGLFCALGFLMFAAIVGNSQLQDELSEAKQKCQAIELFDNTTDEKPFLNYYVSKVNCDSIYTNVYNLKDSEFKQAVFTDYEAHKGQTAAGHDIEWFLSQVKSN